MCLIAIAIDPPGPWCLVIAANRDEYHERPTAPAQWWPDGCTLAGVDLRAGGTWLGLRLDRASRSLRFGALTNIRPGLMPSAPLPDGDATVSPAAPPMAPSRGRLVAGWLAADDRPWPHLERLVPQAQASAGFNLFALRLSAGERGASCAVEGAYLHNLSAPAASPPQALGTGLHLASNATLGTVWPKTSRLGEAMRRELSHAGRESGDRVDPITLTERVFASLADRTEAELEQMPRTGLEAARERLLSAAFIVDPVYGTRCSTVVAVSRRGEASFAERRFAPDGRPVATVHERFVIG